MQKNHHILGSAPLGALLFRLALPTVVAQLINMLYTVVDRIYIGHILNRRRFLYARHDDHFGICRAGRQ